MRLWFVRPMTAFTVWQLVSDARCEQGARPCGAAQGRDRVDNCYNIFDAALPFGGYKQSGWGREMGEAVLDNYLSTKAVTIRL